MKADRVLQVVPNMQQGGLENFIMNIYRNIDRDKIQFDFLVHYTSKKNFDDEIEQLGGKIYRFSLREDNNIIKYILQLNKFFKQHKEYKIVHCHMSSVGFLVFLIAKMNGVKVRIAHSHNSDTEKNLKGFIKRILIKPYKYVSKINWACSEKAGIFLFKNKKFEVIPNAIDTKKFEFNTTTREAIRKELGIQNDFVVGNVGRFCQQKNHSFLIDVFNELLKIRPNSKLLLIGTGELEEEIKQKVKEMKIEDKVLFLGIRKNVNEFYQAMDCFVLTSFFEGLPVVGVEAQASGLKCVFSDRITNEIKLIDEVFLVDIDKTAHKWATIISKEYVRKNTREQIIDKKFDIVELAKNIEKMYKQLIEGEEEIE